MQVFLDTNIFLYPGGSPHPERDACLQILQRVADGSLVATTNTEVVQEILYVLIRRGKREEALVLSATILDLFPELLPVKRDEIARARDLLRRYPGLSVRDAIHAASMMENGVDTIVSLESDFDLVSEIRRVNPRDLLR
jgi:predicted nucleic acid-binding protein